MMTASRMHLRRNNLLDRFAESRAGQGSVSSTVSSADDDEMLGILGLCKILAPISSIVSIARSLWLVDYWKLESSSGCE